MSIEEISARLAYHVACGIFIGAGLWAVTFPVAVLYSLLKRKLF